MTPADVITQVRALVSDATTPFRYSDATLLGFVNQTLKKMSILRPDLFIQTAEVETIADSVTQTLPGDAVRLVEVFGVVGGHAVTEADREMMDKAYPQWRSTASGTPVNFMRHPRNESTYFLYPRPAEGVRMLVEYARIPQDYGLADTITAPLDSYFPVIVDGAVYLTEAVDDEHVSSGRAKAFMDSFTQALGVSLDARKVTDSDSAGMNPEQIS